MSQAEHPASAGLTRWQTAGLIAFLVIVWGLSWPIYKVALHDTPPVLFAGLRTLLGGLCLGTVAIFIRRPLRLRESWRVYLVSTLFNSILFFGLQTVGLTYLPEGLFSVLVYLEPVLVGVFAWLWLGEPLGWAKLAGLFFGFAGVAVISLGSLAGHLQATGTVLGLLTALCWAIGTVYLKRHEGNVDLVWLVSIQFLTGGLILTGLGSVIEPWSAIRWTPAFWMGLLFGGFFGVSSSWLAWFKLVRSGEASRVAAYTFLVPLFAVVSGALILHEQMTWRLLAGLILIVASITLVNRRPGQRPGSGTPSAAAPHTALR